VGKRRGLTGDPNNTMRWRRSMFVVSSSSSRAFLAAGRDADSPDRSHPAESVGLAPAAAFGAVLRPEAVGATNRADREEKVHGDAVREEMASISWLAAAGSFCCCECYPGAWGLLTRFFIIQDSGPVTRL
jgi:hypothetical protein